MNRIAVIGTFTAIQCLLESKNYEGIERVVSEILREAKTPETPESGGN